MFFFYSLKHLPDDGLPEAELLHDKKVNDDREQYHHGKAERGKQHVFDHSAEFVVMHLIYGLSLIHI